MTLTRRAFRYNLHSLEFRQWDERQPSHRVEDMKGVRGLPGFGFACLILLSLGATAFAGQPIGREERIHEATLRVERVIASLDEAEATARLAAAFRVPPRAVTDLRDQKLRLGDVAVVLALSEIGKTSPDTILSLWASGRLNWGEIANRLKVDLPTLLRRLDAARRELAQSNR